MTALISLDLRPLSDLLADLRSPDGLRQLTEAMVGLTQTVWSAAVSGQHFDPMDRPLFSDRYYQAIWDKRSVDYQGDGIAEIDPSIAFPGAEQIEAGTPPYDMKPKLLGGGKVKTGKDGVRYRDIPFRHATPGNDLPKKNFASTMPGDVYRVVSQLPAWGRYQGTETPITKQATGSMSGPYTHKAGLRDDMRREPTASGGSQYRSYRRVSDNSDPDSWMHPGLDKLPVTEAVVLEVKKSLADIVGAWVADVAKHPRAH